jgi:threonyl-tRNA synthetase
MASAVCKLFGDVKLDIGPATETGFYYDFDLSHRLSPEDFPAIEQKMREIINQNLPFEEIVMSREEASDFLSRQKQDYKLKRLADIPAGERITFYRCGDFMDLCKGPHLSSTGEIKAFKLISVAGSYFKGLETNPMLQRIYGIAAFTEEELQNELQRLAEAERRDHRKLGRELDLFSINENVGPGLVLWHPRGGRIRSIIEEFWRQEHFKAGYEILYTPHIGLAKLWETSGHLNFYRESMYSPIIIDENEYFVKPMNCPFHIQIYKSSRRSYKELPLRWAELGTVYRYEKSGVLHGLLRVRGFTQDDAHIFCTPEQVETEVMNAVQLAIKILSAFGLEHIHAFLSTRPEKSVGSTDRWEQATCSLENALKKANITYDVDKGGGAFYGPKIDLKIRDAIGREWQMSTIQFDFNLPERFDLIYIGQDGKEHRPYMVHRALLGAMERFMGILLEHCAGAFPFWLAPEQVRILPISEKQLSYAEEVAEKLTSQQFRVGVDYKSEKLGAKIRRAQLEKIPYVVIIGAEEVKTEMVSVRSRENGDIGRMKLDDIIAILKEQNVPGYKNKKL